jgi:hypothetical protein
MVGSIDPAGFRNGRNKPKARNKTRLPMHKPAQTAIDISIFVRLSFGPLFFCDMEGSLIFFQVIHFQTHRKEPEAAFKFF